MKPQKLYIQVELALSEDIASGLYRPGDSLPPERELMERFGVGRPSVREALFSLARRGLIELGSGRPPRVVEPNFDVVLGELDILARQAMANSDNIFHLMELRRIIESALARKLANEITDAQIEDLRDFVERNQAALGDLQKFWRTDSDFHRAIAKMNGNPLLPTIIDAILSWLIDNRRVTLSQPGSDLRAYEDHKEIFEAIAARQPDRAEAAMARHLLSVEDRVRDLLDNYKSAQK